jgi:hypothetical protein
MKKIHIHSTSNVTAVVDDIVLRETSSTRLIFRPMIVENPRDRRAAIRGAFIFQHKRGKDGWVNHKELSLSELKGSEWVKVDLKSREILILFQSLASLYRIHSKFGIPFGDEEYVSLDSGVAALVTASEDELSNFLGAQPDDALKAFAKLLRWASGLEDCARVVNELTALPAEGLQSINSLVGLGLLRTALDVWEENEGNPDEEFWQRTLGEQSVVLSQMFSKPVVILKEKAYVGGKAVSNTRGNLVDFLMKSNIGNNAILVEIKTPKTPLLGGQYRNGVYSFSSEASGAVIQVATYKQSLVSEYANLVQGGEEEFETFDPHCVVIVGHHKDQLSPAAKRRSFELFRSQLSAVELVTYDELFGKIRLLAQLLSASLGQSA